MPTLIQQLVGPAGATGLVSGTKYIPSYDPGTQGTAADGMALLTPDQVRSYVGDPLSVAIPTPGASEKVIITFTRVALTFSEIASVLIGSATPSITFSVRFGADPSGSGTEMKTGGITVTGTTSATVTAVTSAATGAVPSNSFVWVTTSAQSGTVTQLHVSVVP